jgi:hypothetical protein
MFEPFKIEKQLRVLIICESGISYYSPKLNINLSSQSNINVWMRSFFKHFLRFKSVKSRQS